MKSLSIMFFGFVFFLHRVLFVLNLSMRRMHDFSHDLVEPFKFFTRMVFFPSLFSLGQVNNPRRIEIGVRVRF
jgi:hypothetical protein